jgi:hypothetical protein
MVNFVTEQLSSVTGFAVATLAVQVPALHLELSLLGKVKVGLTSYNYSI